MSGIVGSTAYGLAGPDSDIDRLGVFALPSAQFLGLHPPLERNLSTVQTKPDITLHEASKMCRLLLKCNPSVSELLWLPGDLYETRTMLGDALLAIREAFPSANLVHKAYFNYAADQFKKLINGGPATDEDPEQVLTRRKKNARHILRLLDQGLHFYRTGELIVRVDDPKRYFDFGEDAVADPEVVKAFLSVAESAFMRQPSALPPKPNEPAVEDWLLSVRNHFHKV
jgi:predicted nucleotidyltransferase